MRRTGDGLPEVVPEICDESSLTEIGRLYLRLRRAQKNIQAQHRAAKAAGAERPSMYGTPQWDAYLEASDAMEAFMRGLR